MREKETHVFIIFFISIVLLFSPAFSGAQSPWYYAVTGPGGSNEITVDQIGQVLYFELDSITPNYVWGNIRVDFDPAMLECVSIEENPWIYGFWTAWVPESADANHGGRGTLYYYDDTGLGSDWAQEWVARSGSGQAGPVGSYDNTLGVIRFYTFTPAGGHLGAYPLRLGFRVKQAGTAVFTTYANDWTQFSWPGANALTPSESLSIEASQSSDESPWLTWDIDNLPYRLTSAVTFAIPFPGDL